MNNALMFSPSSIEPTRFWVEKQLMSRVVEASFMAGVPSIGSHTKMII
jgi:hypothetical protein